MQIVCVALRLYEIVLIIRILMSWIRPDPSNMFVYYVHRITDPVLDPVRRMLPLSGMGIDFSPIIVFLLLGFIARAFGCRYGLF